jgi:hypothetical protein
MEMGGMGFRLRDPLQIQEQLAGGGDQLRILHEIQKRYALSKSLG